MRLCGRPGCSEVGAVAYGMVPEDLLFWIAPINEAPTTDPSLLCQRHADAMIVPRGWTLDDRREATLHLFNTRQLATAVRPTAPQRRRTRTSRASRPEQMQIDGTGEIGRPDVTEFAEPPSDAAPDAPPDAAPDAPVDAPVDEVPAPWQPEFNPDDDLNGLLEVESPLLARAFRGTDRPKH